jgi:hypothetical protein
MTANALKFTFSFASALSMSASRPGLFTNETEICFAVCIVETLSESKDHAHKKMGSKSSPFDLMRRA